MRVDGGEGLDTFAIDDRRLDLKAAGDRVRIGDVELDGVEIVRATADELSIADLSATDVFQVDADADRTTAYGSDGRRPDLARRASGCSARRSCSSSTPRSTAT